MTGKRMLIDTSKCTACRACQVACKQWHSLPAEDTTFTGSYQNPPDNSGANLTVVRFIEAEVGDKLRFLFFNNRCRHCQDPRCKAACPRKAIKRQVNGIVRIDSAICNPGPGIGACSQDPIYVDRPCQRHCMFKNGDGTGIPRWQYVKDGSPVQSKMRKCDFCYNRFTNLDLKTPPFVSADGKTKSALPSCQVTCPPGAIKTGAADAMLTKANKRVTFLKTHGYPNANVYPADFPTHVIWVLIESPETYGLTEM